jgi:hypothetical protein|tara:strand:+ start:99 stop:983 length:885 start_codon:yes stop_codon:yes gene_type:complete
MVPPQQFILDLHNNFETVRELLINLLKEEETLENNILAKSGFIIKRYSLKVGAINLHGLRELKEELEKVEEIEENIKYRIREAKDYLRIIEREYYVMHKKNLNLKRIFTQTMNNAFQMSRLSIVRITELIKLLIKLGPGLKLHNQNLGEKAERLLMSLEKMTNQILKFINLLEQLSIKIGKFEKNKHYSYPRIYGRAMNQEEFAKTKKDGQLSSSKNQTPVFDAPRSVIVKIKPMSKDQMKTFFGQIGVVGGMNVVFFQTRLKPVNHDNPIPQSNRLREYKFPKGTPIEILLVA